VAAFRKLLPIRRAVPLQETGELIGGKVLANAFGCVSPTDHGVTNHASGLPQVARIKSQSPAVRPKHFINGNRKVMPNDITRLIVNLARVSEVWWV
jgi:hypothetical protein